MARKSQRKPIYRRQGARLPRTLLGCERLEDRRLLAVTATFNSATGVLTVLGDAGDNLIVVGRTVAGDLEVSGEGASVPISGGTPTISDRIVVRGGVGDDSISIDESNGPMPGSVLSGNDGDDLLVGGSGPDVLTGLAGDDVLLGGDGIDSLSGGDGDDFLAGDEGDDLVAGRDGADTLFWEDGDGDDRLNGGPDADLVSIRGSMDADEIAITPNGAQVRVTRSNLTPFLLRIRDTETVEVNGEDGDDMITSDPGPFPAPLALLDLNGGEGNDQLRGSNAADNLSGDGGDDLLIGNKGDDTMNGGGGNDVLVWNNGDNSDVMDGESGDDQVVVNGANGPGDEFEISANGERAKFDRVNLIPFTLDIGTVEGLLVNGLAGDDKLTIFDLTGVDLAAIVATGGSGHDTIDASAKGVAVGLIAHGGSGDDTLIGSAGVDLIFGEGGADTLLGNAANDSLSGGDDDDSLDGGDGIDILDGGDGTDTGVNGEVNTNIP